MGTATARATAAIKPSTWLSASQRWVRKRLSENLIRCETIR